MVATYSKPITLPIWADTGTIVVPSSAKQSQGWLNTEKPPASFFNWYQNLAGNWMRWFDERLDDSPPKWLPLTAYVIGDRRANVGNEYIVTVAGTSAASGGPTGPGTGIIDGTVTWDFVGAANANIFVIKNPNAGTSQLRTITTGGVQIDTGLNIGFTGVSGSGEIRIGSTDFSIVGGPTSVINLSVSGAIFIQGELSSDRLFLNTSTEQLLLTPGGVEIDHGLSVGTPQATPVSNTIHLKDVNFGLDFTTAIPFVIFDSTDTLSYDRTANELVFNVGSILGSIAGDQRKIADLKSYNGNDAHLRTFLVRTTAGASWETSATYIQNVTDVTYQNFVAFFGTNAVAPLTGWTGMTTAGVGIGAVSNAGPPALSSPTVFVDNTKLYIRDAVFYLSFAGADPFIKWNTNHRNVFDRGLSRWLWQNEISGSREELTLSGNAIQLNLQGAASAGGTAILNLVTTADTTDASLGVISTGNSSVSTIAAVAQGTGTAKAQIKLTAVDDWVLAETIVSSGLLTFGAGAFISRTGSNPLEMGAGSTGLALYNNTTNVHKALLTRVNNTSGVIIPSQRCLAYGTTGYNASYISVRMYPNSGSNQRFAGVSSASIAIGDQGWACLAGSCSVVTANAISPSSANSYLQYQSGTTGSAQHVSSSSAATLVLGIPLTGTAAGLPVTCQLMPTII